jgi:hypothetical protein
MTWVLHRRLVPIALMFACLLLIGGCAAQHASSGSKATPAVPGLAVVDCEVRHHENGPNWGLGSHAAGIFASIALGALGSRTAADPPDAGSVIPVDTAGNDVKGNSVKGKEIDGLLVFAGLAPGVYSLQRIDQGRKGSCGGVPSQEWSEDYDLPLLRRGQCLQL